MGHNMFSVESHMDIDIWSDEFPSLFGWAFVKIYHFFFRINFRELKIRLLENKGIALCRDKFCKKNSNFKKIIWSLILSYFCYKDNIEKCYDSANVWGFWGITYNYQIRYTLLLERL